MKPCDFATITFGHHNCKCSRLTIRKTGLGIVRDAWIEITLSRYFCDGGNDWIPSKCRCLEFSGSCNLARFLICRLCKKIGWIQFEMRLVSKMPATADGLERSWLVGFDGRSSASAGRDRSRRRVVFVLAAGMTALWVSVPASGTVAAGGQARPRPRVGQRPDDLGSARWDARWAGGLGLWGPGPSLAELRVRGFEQDMQKGCCYSKMLLRMQRCGRILSKGQQIIL